MKGRDSSELESHGKRYIVHRAFCQGRRGADIGGDGAFVGEAAVGQVDKERSGMEAAADCKTRLKTRLAFYRITVEVHTGAHAKLVERQFAAETDIHRRTVIALNFAIDLIFKQLILAVCDIGSEVVMVG